MTPRVSVVVPVFNGEHTLAATLESALTQTLEEIEVIVVDDGSRDGTPDVIAGFDDPRLVRLHQPNRGVSAARNHGLQRARSPYVAFLDADDLWTPNKLADQVAVLEHGDRSAAYSWTDYIDVDGRHLGPGCHLSHSGDVLAPLLVTNFIESGSNPLVRRNLLNDCGGFDTSLANAADWDLWLRLARRCHFGVVPEAQVLYRRLPSAMSSDLDRQEWETRRVLERALQRSPELSHLRRDSRAALHHYLAEKAERPSVAVRQLLLYALFERSKRHAARTIISTVARRARPGRV